MRIDKVLGFGHRNHVVGCIAIPGCAASGGKSTYSLGNLDNCIHCFFCPLARLHYQRAYPRIVGRIAGYMIYIVLLRQPHPPNIKYPYSMVTSRCFVSPTFYHGFCGAV